MNWTIKFSEKAQKEIKYLDHSIQRRIRDMVTHKLGYEANKFLIPLVGKFSGLYKFRVGDYRLICEKHDHELVVLVIKVKHRKEVYK